MRISDLWIDVREDDEIAVTRLPGGVRLDLGHGTAQSVTVLLPSEKAVSLAAALAPEAVASNATASEWPCEPVSAGDRIVVEKVPGCVNRYDGATAVVVTGRRYENGYITAEFAHHDTGKRVQLLVNSWRLAGAR
jgi:hypothetical protein